MSGWSHDPDDPGPSGGDGRYAPARQRRAASKIGERFVPTTVKTIPMFHGLHGAERRVADAFAASCIRSRRRAPMTFSHAAIAKAAEVSVRTAKYALAKMEAVGALAVEHNWGRGKRCRFWPVFAWGLPPERWAKIGKIRQVPAHKNRQGAAHFGPENRQGIAYPSASTSSTKVDEVSLGGKDKAPRESPSSSLATEGRDTRGERLRPLGHVCGRDCRAGCVYLDDDIEGGATWGR
jgi:hypothetical protein